MADVPEFKAKSEGVLNLLFGNCSKKSCNSFSNSSNEGTIGASQLLSKAFL